MVRLLMHILTRQIQLVWNVLSIALPWLAARAGSPLLPKTL